MECDLIDAHSYDEILNSTDDASSEDSENTNSNSVCNYEWTAKLLYHETLILLFTVMAAYV